MTQPDNPALREQVVDFLGKYPEDALTWVEAHGLLCALACGPTPAAGWQTLVIEEHPVPDIVAAALETLRQRLHAQLGLGESLQLPCRLDPYEESEGRDLASWCAGFVTGVMGDEDAWHQVGEARLVEMLLPFLLISGLDEDSELDTLWQDTRLVRQMALGIPELIEELFLLYHAPGLADDDASPEEH